MNISIRTAAHHARPSRSVWAIVANMLSVRRQRARLAQLDDHLLEDIGLTRAEAEAESRTPFWDAPQHWLR